MMMVAFYKSGDDNKSDNNKDKVFLLLRKWGLVCHVLDHVLDHIIIGLVTTALYLDQKPRATEI